MKILQVNKNGLLTWCCLLMALVMVSIQRQEMAAFSTYMTTKLNVSEAKVSNLSTATMYGLMIMQIPAGVFVDKFGVRKTNILLLTLTSISSLLVFFTNNYYLALLGRFFVGIGVSASAVSVFKVQSDWFKVSQFTFLSAVMMFMANIGAFITTSPLSMLINNVGGRQALVIVNVYTILCNVLVIAFVKDNTNIKQKRCRINLWSGLKQVMSNPFTHAPMILIFFMLGTTSSLLGFWAVSFLKETYSINPVEAAGYFSYFTIGFMAGTVVSSIVDKIKWLNYKLNLNIFTFIYASVWFYIMILHKGQPSLKSIPILFFIMGLSVANHLFAFTAVKMVNKAENVGTATSALTSMDFAGSIVLNSIITSKIQNGGTISQAFIYMFAFSVIAFLASFFVKYKKTYID